VKALERRRPLVILPSAGDISCGQKVQKDTLNRGSMSYYVPMSSVKEQVLEAIQRLPDDIDFRDVAEEIAFLAAVGEAESDIHEGRVVSNEAMKSRITGWTQR
jgi:hypothetical protein